MFICETCKVVNDGTYGSGRFCSVKCARSFSARKTDELKQRISKTLSKPKTIIQCKECGDLFIQQRKRVFCSNVCSVKFRWKTPNYRNKMQSIIDEKAKDGNWGGWKVRNKEPSYAEKYFIDVLNNEGISFNREKYVDGFFIDFAIAEKRIALEIDGSQHFLHNDRIDSDKKKDKVLLENGWHVFRIRWFSPNSESGKLKLKEQIDKFLKFLSSTNG